MKVKARWNARRSQVVLTNPSGATLADGTGNGTITNDDAAPLPTLNISDASVIEGNPGSGNGGGGAADGWLSTSGNQIVDAAGHSVQIAGVCAIGTFKTVLSLQRVEMSARAGKCRPLAFADGMHVHRM